MKPPIIFSILHTSARPDKWRKVYDAWIAAAVHPELVEYVLVVDERWGFAEDELNVHEATIAIQNRMRPQDQVIWNTGRKCYVEGVNLAAAASCGLMLIVNADDQYPCQDWDEHLGEMSTAGIPAPIDDFVVEVNTGTPKEHERGIIVLPIMSRPRYRRLGYVLYPEYESMYSDNDFYAHAKAEERIIDCRHIPVFPHRHYLFTPDVPNDAAYREQNKPSAYSHGKALFEARVQHAFQNVAIHETVNSGAKKSVMCLLPGEKFSMLWVSGWSGLLQHLLSRYNVNVNFGYSSNVYATRGSMAHSITSQGQEHDYILWLDDDNILTPHQFEQLKEDLDRNNGLDVVVGWCWVQHDGYGFEGAVSCGYLDDVQMSRPMSVKELMDGQEPVKQIDWSGFPVVLMKGTRALKAAGKYPFAAITDERFSWGMAGEDVSFFVRAGRGGCKFAVDRRVEVPHFKTRPVGPEKEPYKGMHVVHMNEP